MIKNLNNKRMYIIEFITQRPLYSHRSIDSKDPSRQDAWRMFDRIAPRYDLLNKLLSLYQDVGWRKVLTKGLPIHSNQIVLDLATGTADVLLSLFKNSTKVIQGIGIDMACDMLKYGRRKVYEKDLNNFIHLIPGDASAIPFAANQFDVVTIAFGIRNVMDVKASLAEIYRVLKPSGKVLILEFSLPENRILKTLYLLYFRNILPRIGFLISGDAYAYRYLNKTVESFPYGETFCNLIRAVGFQSVDVKPLTFGIASIYRGEKPVRISI